jgi:hypothetical protein
MQFCHIVASKAFLSLFSLTAGAVLCIDRRENQYKAKKMAEKIIDEYKKLSKARTQQLGQKLWAEDSSGIIPNQLK